MSNMSNIEVKASFLPGISRCSSRALEPATLADSHVDLQRGGLRIGHSRSPTLGMVRVALAMMSRLGNVAVGDLLATVCGNESVAQSADP
jgi:hypothetical protein